MSTSGSYLHRGWGDCWNGCTLGTLCKKDDLQAVFNEREGQTGEEERPEGSLEESTGWGIARISVQWRGRRGKWNLLAGTETSNLCSEAEGYRWKWHLVTSLKLMIRGSNLKQREVCHLNLWDDSVVAVVSFWVRTDVIKEDMRTITLSIYKREERSLEEFEESLVQDNGPWLESGGSKGGVQSTVCRERTIVKEQLQD